MGRALHPDFVPTPALKASLRAHLGRMNAAMGLHAKRWRLARIKRLRAGLLAVWRTQDKALISRWLADYSAAIISECRFLENSARPEFTDFIEHLTADAAGEAKERRAA